MIRYVLKCEAEHRFEAWFSSSTDYDRLRAAGHVTCAICGSGGVDKTLMAPAVASGGDEPTPELPPSLTAAARELAELRCKILEGAECVGRNFAHEARRIHAGEAPDRPIWGEARLDEARSLVEEGVPIAPLPPDPQKAN